MVDEYSRYLDICFLSKTTSLAVIGHLKKIFARHGVPETLFSNYGPQFSSSEFKAFSNFWNFQHVTTSPPFPQANGAAEHAVQTAKHILNQDDVFLALLVCRAFPIVELKASPAELVYGRKLRTTLPAPPKSPFLSFSSACLPASTVETPIHSPMSCVHLLLGLPLPLLPSDVPSKNSFPNVLCRLMWPKYDYFCFLNRFKSCGTFTPSCSRTLAFVFLSVHEILSIFQ